MIRALLSFIRAHRVRTLAQRRAELIPLANSKRPGCQVAQHQLTALTTAQLRLEVGR